MFKRFLIWIASLFDRPEGLELQFVDGPEIHRAGDEPCDCVFCICPDPADKISEIGQTPQIPIIREHPLDEPMVWLRSPAHQSPLSAEELALVQKELDSIVGTTRDGRSIAKIIWNGDTKYWKEYFDRWDTTGKPIGRAKKRPIVLYKSIFDDAGSFLRDAFPPRWLVVTRIEPEQYARSWAKDAEIYHPALQRKVLMKPEVPPDEWFLWYMTIGDHTAHCCSSAAAEERSCYGKYVHPRACLEVFRDVRKGIEASGFKDSVPFDQPDAVARRMRERETNNYDEQVMDAYEKQASWIISEAPLSLASGNMLEKGATMREIRRHAAERVRRGAAALEAKLKQQQ